MMFWGFRVCLPEAKTRYQSCLCVCVCSVSQCCLTLCGPVNCSPPGSSAHGISRQEYWNGVPFPTPGDLPVPGIEPASLISPELTSRFFPTSTYTTHTHTHTHTHKLYPNLSHLNHIHKSYFVHWGKNGAKEKWYLTTFVNIPLYQENFAKKYQLFQLFK